MDCNTLAKIVLGNHLKEKNDFKKTKQIIQPPQMVFISGFDRFLLGSASHFVGRMGSTTIGDRTTGSFGSLPIGGYLGLDIINMDLRERNIYCWKNMKPKKPSP
jgi:hypothetical protein